MHDLDAIAVFEPVLRMLRTWDDGAIDLDRDATLRKALARQQGCDGGVGFGLAPFAIERDLHRAILARNDGWACGGATCDR